MNRIYFKDNPWPSGHGIKEFEWLARLIPDSGIWFDLHLKSADYYEEDTEDIEEDDIPEDTHSWLHKEVWNNYHQAIISSTYWGNKGFLAGTEMNKLDFYDNKTTTFQVEMLPLESNESFDDSAFGIYLLGHDAVAGHHIRFEKDESTSVFTVHWTGRIALNYSGEIDYDYEFDASISNVAFGGIELPNGCSIDEGHRLLEKYVSDINAFEWSPEQHKFLMRK